jgi:anthranilate/para-aminobenzoate synthase component I
MTIAPDIATDLVTPLGAYLRLRRRGAAAFLLESVERGRLGRHSLVGCGSHLCYFAEAEACGEPVVGYLAYDYAARLEPSVPLPDEGTELPENRFVVADVLIRFDHVFCTAEVIRGDPEEVAALLGQPVPLELDGLALVGSSPETLVKCERRRATVNPIAGTTELSRASRTRHRRGGDVPGRRTLLTGHASRFQGRR